MQNQRGRHPDQELRQEREDDELERHEDAAEELIVIRAGQELAIVREANPLRRATNLDVVEAEPDGVAEGIRDQAKENEENREKHAVAERPVAAEEAADGEAIRG